MSPHVSPDQIAVMNCEVTGQIIEEQVARFSSNPDAQPDKPAKALLLGIAMSQLHRDRMVSYLGACGVEADTTAAIEPLLNDPGLFPFSPVIESLTADCGDPLAAMYADKLGSQRLHRQRVKQLRSQRD